MELETIEKEAIEKVEKEKLLTKTFPEITPKELLETLSLTIKDDEANKLSVFLACLTAYTEDDQINIIFSAPTSTGKSFIAVEITKLFPENDVLDLARATPTSFFYQGEYNQETKEYIVDLQRKIIVFLDMPNPLLLANLRPLLSKDKKVLNISIVDRSKRNKEMRTKKIKVVGFPSVIFCSAYNFLDSQELSRSLVISPEISQEKMLKSLDAGIERSGSKKTYFDNIENNEARNTLKERILAIKAQNIDSIVIPEEIQADIKALFRGFGQIQPKTQRDSLRFTSLLKAFTLLNIWTRERNENNDIIADKKDFDNAVALWDEVRDSQEIGLSPYLLSMYKKVIVPVFNEKQERTEGLTEGLTKQEIALKHIDVFGSAIGERKLVREILPSLENAGLILYVDDPDDKRKTLIKPLKLLKKFIKTLISE